MDSIDHRIWNDVDLKPLDQDRYCHILMLLKGGYVESGFYDKVQDLYYYDAESINELEIANGEIVAWMHWDSIRKHLEELSKLLNEKEEQNRVKSKPTQPPPPPKPESPGWVQIKEGQDPNKVRR